MVVDENTAGMILARLVEGQRVALVALNWQHASWAQQDIMGALDNAELTGEARSKRGQIQLGQGRLTFHPLTNASQGLRGASLDAIYLPTSWATTEAEEAAMLSCLMARDGIMLSYNA
jgi:hypothetical protein